MPDLNFIKITPTKFIDIDTVEQVDVGNDRYVEITNAAEETFTIRDFELIEAFLEQIKLRINNDKQRDFLTARVEVYREVLG